MNGKRLLDVLLQQNELVAAKLEVYKEDVVDSTVHRNCMWEIKTLEGKRKVEAHANNIFLKDLQQQHLIRELCLFDHHNLKYMWDEGNISTLDYLQKTKELPTLSTPWVEKNAHYNRS